MKRPLAFSLLILGLSSLVAQVVLVRELMVVFYGNEFFIGWTLFAWLFWVGLGSALFGRILDPAKHGVKALVGSHASVALLFPAQIVLVRNSRIWVGGIPGTVPDLLPAMGLTFLALAPLCLILGGQFIAAAKAWTVNDRSEKINEALGQAYICETFGFVLGGLLFAYGLVFMNAFCVAGIVAGLNSAAGFVLYAALHQRIGALRLALMAAVAIATASLFFSVRLNNYSESGLFPEQTWVESENSIYGQIAVTRLGDQYNFYENGLLFGTTDDTPWNETLVHLPLLSHANPKRILLLGGGLTGALAEILKHNPEQVDYVELDPLLITLTRRYLSPAATACLDDPRVHTITEDARFFLNRRSRDRAERPYDVLLVNLPNPSTVLINRFYSREFFALAKSVLAPGGMLCAHLAFSPDYLSPELENLGASIYKTISAVFPSVLILPETTAFFLASPDAALNCNPQVLIHRLSERHISTRYLSARSMEHRLATSRIGSVVAAFEKNKTSGINRDERPVACYYNFIHWISSFYPNLARTVQSIGTIGPTGLIGLFLLGAALLGTTTARGTAERKTASLALWGMGMGSFSLMTAEVALLLMVQALYGYLYHQIALLLAALMLGMAMGTWVGTRSIHREPTRALRRIHAALAVYMLLLIAVFLWAGATHTEAFRAIFPLLAALIGSLVGYEFTVANRLYLDVHQENHRKAGLIYAVDLLGSSLGALLISLLLIPLIGVRITLLFVVALNIALVVAGKAETKVNIV